MTFVTKLTFQSGDRAALEDVVTEIQQLLARKGAECHGPHSDPPEQVRAPQYRGLSAGKTYEPWKYTVYRRRLEIHGNEQVAGQIGHMDFPESVHVEIEIDRKTPLGQGRK